MHLSIPFPLPYLHICQMLRLQKSLCYNTTNLSMRLFFTTRTLFLSSWWLSVFAYIRFGAQFGARVSRTYAIIWICYIKRRNLQFECLFRFRAFLKGLVVQCLFHSISIRVNPNLVQNPGRLVFSLYYNNIPSDIIQLPYVCYTWLYMLILILTILQY